MLFTYVHPACVFLLCLCNNVQYLYNFLFSLMSLLLVNSNGSLHAKTLDKSICWLASTVDSISTVTERCWIHLWANTVEFNLCWSKQWEISFNKLSTWLLIIHRSIPQTGGMQCSQDFLIIVAAPQGIAAINHDNLPLARPACNWECWAM